MICEHSVGCEVALKISLLHPARLVGVQHFLLINGQGFQPIPLRRQNAQFGQQTIEAVAVLFCHEIRLLLSVAGWPRLERVSFSCRRLAKCEVIVMIVLIEQFLHRFVIIIAEELVLRLQPMSLVSTVQTPLVLPYFERRVGGLFPVCRHP